MKTINFIEMENLNGGLCVNDAPGNSCFGHCGALFLAASYAGDNFGGPIIACL